MFFKKPADERVYSLPASWTDAEGPDSQAVEAWRAVAKPHQRSLDSGGLRPEAKVARLERAQQARGMAPSPPVPLSVANR